MLFWTRAFLCIGTVTVMAIQRLPPETKPVSVPTLAAPAAAALLGDACRARPDLCAAAVTRGLGALAPGGAGPDAHGAASVRAKLLHRTTARDLPVALGFRSLT